MVFTHTYAQNSADTFRGYGFRAYGEHTEGSLPDNVSIDQTAAVSGAPEPGSLALLSGAIPVALALRKRLIS
jgi:hypothetical protein